ncbi:MAG TPA: proline dehydrogenase family protein [Gemmatimonadaceae bacterium]|jgi:proline dehydrogenase|nr:proline dehydrogenase family protein [Gemmatimonadaceae bacterium]
MLRSALLYLSNQPKVFSFVRNNRMAKSFASRFIPGETLDSALDAVRKLNADGITASLDLLGESVRNEKEARDSAQQYIGMLDRIKESGVDANVSVKLTAMGLDIAEDLCVANMQNILDRAREHETFVRIDMEGSDYTQKTLDIFYNRLYPCYRGNVGIVLQSYLYRSFSDAQQANAAAARVRLCKGAYKEPASVAYPEKKDVDDSYLRCMRSLLLEGHYPGIATHDERMVRETKRFAIENDIKPDRFEFQMLYGVRRDLQHKLVREGYRMRVYVPFGTQWYPYLMRRLAERPANVAFMTASVLKEMVARNPH